jgi:probable FeS assembly SUF system protein SufT
MTPETGPISLTRDCKAIKVPEGHEVTLEKGEEAHLVQSLGGSHTIVVNGNMFRVNGPDADAIGLEKAEASIKPTEGKEGNEEELVRLIWDQMKTVYDPEIPVNIVDLGLIYSCDLTDLAGGGKKVDVQMTLTAPGCGMGDVLRQDVQTNILMIDGIDEVDVDLVWEPQWGQEMMSEEARLQLGLM